MTKLIEKVNVSALVARATYLRNGISCSIRPLQYNRSTRRSLMGGMNYHIFRDGVSWLARICRFNATSPPTALRDYILQSEVATLRFLQKTNVLAPQVFDFALEGKDNPVGVGYILMEKMAGSSLRWASASPEQRQKVMNQLVDVFIETTELSVRAYWLSRLHRYRAGWPVRSGISDRLCGFRDASTRSIFVYRSINSIDSGFNTPRRGLHTESHRCVLDSSFSFGYDSEGFGSTLGRRRKVLPQTCGRQRQPYPRRPRI